MSNYPPMLIKIYFGLIPLLIVWTIVEMLKNGITFFNSALLVYLVFVGVTIWVLGASKDTKIEQVTVEEPAPKEPEKKSDEAIILEIIRSKGQAKRHDLLPHLDMSKSTLVRTLDQLEAEGKIVQIGERKATYYTLKA